jgi:hypothetical protein
MAGIRLVLAVLLVSTALPLTAQSGTWTAVGSTGSVDPAAVGIASLNGTDLLYRSPTSTAPINAYYNVTNTLGGGVSDTPLWANLQMTFIDTSPLGSVRATLVEVDPCTGQSRVLCTVLSDEAHTCATCGQTVPFGIDFSKSLYYVEVQLTRTAASANPILRALRIFN